MDALSLLTADHNRVRGLFARFQAAEEVKDTAKMTELAAKIIVELEVHTTIEEEIFYPALQGALPDASDLLEEAQAEHRQVKAMIAQLQAMGTADVSMDALVAELNRAIEHHVKEERDELFPKAKAAQGLDLDALGVQMRERQQALEKDPAAAAA